MVENIGEYDPLIGEKTRDLDHIKLYANSHYVTPRPTLQQAAKELRLDLSRSWMVGDMISDALAGENARSSSLPRSYASRTGSAT